MSATKPARAITGWVTAEQWEADGCDGKSSAAGHAQPPERGRQRGGCEKERRSHQEPDADEPVPHCDEGEPRVKAHDACQEQGAEASGEQHAYQIDPAADYIADLVATRVPAGHAHIVGISLGGAVAHTLLARHAKLLDRVIIDGAGILPWWGNGPYLLFIATIAPFLHTRAVIAALSRSVGGIPEPDQAEFKRASRLAFLKSMADARGTRATRREVRADCPTLLVAGERETAVRRSNAALAAVMPRAVARYVAELGHGWLGRRMELHLDWANGLRPKSPRQGSLPRDHRQLP